jgi:hypothetical protein
MCRKKFIATFSKLVEIDNNANSHHAVTWINKMAIQSHFVILYDSEKGMSYYSSKMD